MINIDNLSEDINQELAILNWMYPNHPVRNCLRAINIVLARERKWLRQLEAAREREKPSSSLPSSSLASFFEDIICVPFSDDTILSQQYETNKTKQRIHQVYITYLVCQLGLRKTATRLQLSHSTIQRIVSKFVASLNKE